MLTLLKKPKPDATEPVFPAWHPDFRDIQRLPDTKVIRTSFLVNGAVALVTAVLLTWFCYEAYQLRGLTNQVADWQLQIDRDKGPSERAIALYKNFEAESAKLANVESFVKSRPVVSEILVHLGKTLPDYLAIDRFDLSAANLNLRGTVRGAPDQASGRASAYIQQLKSDAFFSEKFSEVTLLNLNRNAQTGSLIVEISCKLKEVKKP